MLALMSSSVFASNDSMLPREQNLSTTNTAMSPVKMTGDMCESTEELKSKESSIKQCRNDKSSN